MATYDRRALAAQLDQQEAFRTRIYLDSKGILTVGRGHALGSVPLSDVMRNLMSMPGVMDTPFSAEALEVQFVQDAAEAERQVEALANLRGVDFNALAPRQQQALVNMCFQMGPSRLGGFVKMWAALAVGDMAEAERQALDSKWAREDSPGRAKEVAGMLGEGG